MRLPRQRGEVIDRSDGFEFRWNGRARSAFRGDTIISALAAAGERVFSRSFKYHRRRGVVSASALDPGCLVQVGDEPNVRGAHRQVAPGMDVFAQNVWPSLDFDLRAGARWLRRFLGPGFYYKTFMAPRALWPWYQRLLRHMGTPGGTVPRERSSAYFDKRYAHADVVVAGAGPAGMAAAVASADRGARVMLVEEEHALGGHLRYGAGAHLAELSRLRQEIARREEIEVVTDAVVFGRYDDNWLGIVERRDGGGSERLIKARTSMLVVAPGLIERPYVFDGNDLPGVMLATAVRKLIRLYAVRPGERAVVFSANEEGDAAAADLEDAGVEVVRVVDGRRGEGIRRALGSSGVREVELDDGSRLRADLLVTATGWTAPTSLLNMAGCRPRYSPRAARFLPDALPRGVMATGALTGDGSLEELVAHGHAVGEEAARRAREPDKDIVEIPALGEPAHPELFRSDTHGFVDFSEDVSSKDIERAADEGYTSMQLAKRFTTATMGPAQGKLELMNMAHVHAESIGVSVAEVGTTTWRPPYVPVTLGALAGRNFEPARRSPIQVWHEDHGAVPLVAGQWIRPEHYGNPAEEVDNVRNRVGIIDVTPIGKLDLRGPDVPKLLNLVYVNKWSKLPIGSVRYGVMCAEDGVVLDDGVTGHIGEEHFIMSTTSSGATGVWEWLEDWLQTEHPEWRVLVTPVTSAFASINVAGPKARELMQRLVDDVDLSPDAFPYMRVRRGRIAGVAHSFMWRIGFTGELSYEIHVPAAYGLYVWEALMEHGRDLGIRPFGVEAQRIMRLEKGHFIVGQDTDGLTQAGSVGIGNLIKLDKPDFAGKPELVWQADRGARQRLVAVQTLDGAIVPPEASQIVKGAGSRHILGRITSSRLSPTLGRSICLALVDSDATEDPLTIRLPDGREVTARALDQLAHFDPKGERLRG